VAREVEESLARDSAPGTCCKLTRSENVVATEETGLERNWVTMIQGIPSMPEGECSLGDCARRRKLAAAMTCEALSYICWARRTNCSHLREVTRKDAMSWSVGALN